MSLPPVLLKSNNYESKYLTSNRQLKNLKQTGLSNSHPKFPISGLRITYKLVIRFTNYKIITQVVRREGAQDYTLSEATSQELIRYGLKIGLTNVPAAFCTGLLIATRFLKLYDLPSDSGFSFLIEVGKRMPQSMRMGAVVKGAEYGGLFPSTGNLTEEVMEILNGKLIIDYMLYLQENNPAAYQVQFNKYIEENINPTDLPAIYSNVQQQIFQNPLPIPHTLSKAEYKEMMRERRRKFLEDKEKKKQTNNP